MNLPKSRVVTGGSDESLSLEVRKCRRDGRGKMCRRNRQKVQRRKEREPFSIGNEVSRHRKVSWNNINRCRR